MLEGIRGAVEGPHRRGRAEAHGVVEPQGPAAVEAQEGAVLRRV